MTIPSMTLTELVARIAVAISEMEGYTKEGSRAERQNNPGNLRNWGKTPVVDGFANFPTPAEGWTALRRQIAKNIGRGLTLYEFFGGKFSTKVLNVKVTLTDGTIATVQRETRVTVYPGYAPDSDGNRSRRYAEFVGKRVGIPADVPLYKLHTVRESSAQREEA